MQDRSRTIDHFASRPLETYRNPDPSTVPNGFRPLEQPNRSILLPPRQTNPDVNRSAKILLGISEPGTPLLQTPEISDDESDDEDTRTTASVQDEQPVNPLPLSTLPTGLCYDARMRFHCELDPPKDRSNYHPEDPRRIFHIYRTLCEAGLVKDQMSPQQLVDQPLYRIPARYAKKSEICLVHEERHFDFMESTRGSSTALQSTGPSDPVDIDLI